MRLTIRSSRRIVTVDGAKCQVWTGRTDRGAECLLFVWGVAFTALDLIRPDLAGVLSAGPTVESGDVVSTPAGPCRLWWAAAPELALLVRRIAVPEPNDQTEFVAGLVETPPPADWAQALEVLHPDGNGKPEGRQ